MTKLEEMKTDKELAEIFIKHTNKFEEMKTWAVPIELYSTFWESRDYIRCF